MVRSLSVAAVLWGLGLPFLCGASGWAGEPLAEPVADSKPHVLYLHTEFFPYEKTVDQGLPYRLGREMIRQAILLAARDEMGLATCDETLNETPPNNAHVIHLLPVERTDMHGKANLKLISYEGEGDVWEKTYKFVLGGAFIYPTLLPQLEVDSRGDFLVALRAAGLKGEKPKLQDAQPPGEEIESLLGKVDFVAQYGAVRAAHQAIAAHGETSEWLGVLVRGYGNLALLTKHQWNSSCEVFTARAWLYAQRMVVSSHENDPALWHRAYASAWGGMHLYALHDLTQLKQRAQTRAASGEAENKANAAPSWCGLVEPYCMCDRNAIRQVGEQNAALKPWATRLWFQLASAYRQPRWMYEGATEIREICPTAYGVYADLVEYGRYLGLTRSGAAWAPIAFSQFVPLSVNTVADLPASLQELIAAKSRQEGLFGGLFGGARSSEVFSPLPMLLAEQLREESERAPPADLSWSALAYLLEEEQFVQVAHYMRDAKNATERSLAEDIDAVWPLVKDHRFAAYIGSYRYNLPREADKMQDLLGSFKIDDPRMNMLGMFFRLWSLKNDRGQMIGYTGCSRAYRNFTMQGLLENFESLTRTYEPPPQSFRKVMIDEYHSIAPHLDVDVLLDILWSEDPKLEQLQHWESEVNEDPRAFTHLAEHYQESGDTESAKRCLEKSLALVLTVEATRQLAELYRKQGQWDKWQQTLLGFLEAEDLGLEHAKVQLDLASGCAERGQWRKAKPYAVAYGQTYAARGLRLASTICEGLAEWEESEQWIRAAAESYPSSAGCWWYYWCRRTGRGDLTAARELADKFFAVVENPRRESLVALGAYRVLESDIPGAVEAYRQALSFRPSFSCTFMIAQLSRELGDQKSRKDVLNSMEKAVVAASTSFDADAAKVNTVGIEIVELLRTGDVSRQRIDKIGDLLCELDPVTRSAFAYFLAKELDTEGKTAEAETYWRRSLVTSDRDLACATLSGFELAKRHGTSRADDDELDEDDVWPPLNIEKK